MRWRRKFVLKKKADLQSAEKAQRANERRRRLFGKVSLGERQLAAAKESKPGPYDESPFQVQETLFFSRLLSGTDRFITQTDLKDKYGI